MAKAKSKSYIVDIKKLLVSLNSIKDLKEECLSAINCVGQMPEKEYSDKLYKRMLMLTDVKIQYLQFYNTVDEKNLSILKALSKEDDITLLGLMSEVNLGKTATSNRLKQIYNNLFEIAEPILNFNAH